MKKVITVVETWCDYPGCADEATESQETTTVETWFYVPGRGRKPHPITVEMCDTHLAEMKALFGFMQKYDQKPEAR
jgi:hypothetical protein